MPSGEDLVLAVNRSAGTTSAKLVRRLRAERLLDRIDAPHLARVRAAARERAWEAGAAPERGGELRIDFDATISIAHRTGTEHGGHLEEDIRSTRCWPFWTGRRSRAGRRWPACCGPGNAGSNTATDHVTVLTMALAQLPGHARPRPGDPGSPRVLARSDSAGATHLFAAACRKEGWSSPSGSRSMSASRPLWI